MSSRPTRGTYRQRNAKLAAIESELRDSSLVWSCLEDTNPTDAEYAELAAAILNALEEL